MDIPVLDFDGPGRPVVALHGSFGRGAIFAELARMLSGSARHVAPPQRGHGRPRPAASYSSADLVARPAARV
ncbi:alpha/beta fold hydrolase, partial [Nocardia wallacei]|uniref:alpha/beta fold hydrolase n=1 Tax=Nocardia wallacei TaxID=480035 RepID=UPI003CC7F23A